MGRKKNIKSRWNSRDLDGLTNYAQVLILRHRKGKRKYETLTSHGSLKVFGLGGGPSAVSESMCV